MINKNALWNPEDLGIYKQETAKEKFFEPDLSVVAICGVLLVLLSMFLFQVAHIAELANALV